MRRLIFERGWLSENPVGLHVTWKNGRTHTAEVIGCYRKDEPGIWMLETRYFNGERGPDVSAGIVQVLEREPGLPTTSRRGRYHLS